jgi:hypothetical protein
MILLDGRSHENIHPCTQFTQHIEGCKLITVLMAMVKYRHAFSVWHQYMYEYLSLLC